MTPENYSDHTSLYFWENDKYTQRVLFYGGSVIRTNIKKLLDLLDFDHQLGYHSLESVSTRIYFNDDEWMLISRLKGYDLLLQFFCWEIIAKNVKHD